MDFSSSEAAAASSSSDTAAVSVSSLTADVSSVLCFAFCLNRFFCTGSISGHIHLKKCNVIFIMVHFQVLCMFQSSFILVLKTGDLRSFVVQLFIAGGNHTVRRRMDFLCLCRCLLSAPFRYTNILYWIS